jgi:response regulator RpfG family c-di-GMP phosphodiesterase
LNQASPDPFVVLVVDDDPQPRSALAVLVGLEGAAALQAECGGAAAELLRRLPSAVAVAGALISTRAGRPAAEACRRLHEVNPRLSCWLVNGEEAPPDGFRGALRRPYSR